MDRMLLDYLPSVLQTVREFQCIAEGEQPELVDLWQAVSDTFDDQFIIDATENGVQRWERILTIAPKATSDLAARKFTVLTRLNEQLPFTITSLEQQLASLCGPEGYFLKLANELYSLDVQIALTAKENFNDVDVLLQRVAPANLVIRLTLKYNQQQTLAGFNHSQLHIYKHNDLRNEVIV